MFQVGWLIRRRPGGPPSQVVQLTWAYPTNTRRLEREGEKGVRDKVVKRKRGKPAWNKEGGQGPLAKEGRLYLDIRARAPSSQLHHS